MLTLNDGRSELWQWDTGRTLAVDADCSQVHFSNKVFGRSLDVDVIDGVAAIPDILLQTDKELTAWAFVGTAENGYTKISKVFKVNKRNKPADYVFTPTDQTTLDDILDRIEDLEKRPSGGNGGITKEVDPTVPDWAKQPQKPTYTAADVGALPDTTKIPSTAEDVGALPANAFIPKTAADVGAIPVPETATVGQTIVVKEVDESGKPVSWECVDVAGGGEKWKELRSFSIPTDPSADTSGITWITNDNGEVTGFEFDTDKDGNPFECSELSITTQGTCTADGTAFFVLDGIRAVGHSTFQNNGSRASWGEINKRNGAWRWIGGYGPTMRYLHDRQSAAVTGFSGSPTTDFDTFTKFGIEGSTGFYSGYRFNIWGRCKA